MKRLGLALKAGLAGLLFGLSACGTQGPAGQEITVNVLLGSQPASVPVAYQVGDEDWQLATMRKAGVYRPSSDWPRLWLRIGFASGVMAAVIGLLAPELAQWAQWSVWRRAVQLLLWIAIGAGSYFAALLALGLRLRDLSRG